MDTNSAEDRHQRMQLLNQEWEASEKTQHEFCLEKDISYASFQYWRKKFSGKQPGASDFITVRSVKSSLGVIEIHYPGGVQLRLPTQTSIKDLLRLTGMQ